MTKTGKLYAAGAIISGNITATSGSIAGWEIKSTYLEKQTDDGLHRTYLLAPASASASSNAFAVQTRASVNDSWASVFKVTYGGAVTASNLALTGGSINLKDANGTTMFSVTTAGKVTAKDMKLTGTLTVGSKTISADDLRQGAIDGYNWMNTASAAYGGYTPAAYAIGGGSAGYSAQATWNAAQDSNEGIDLIYAKSILASSISASSISGAFQGSVKLLSMSSYQYHQIGMGYMTDGNGISRQVVVWQ